METKMTCTITANSRQQRLYIEGGGCRGMPRSRAVLCRDKDVLKSKDSKKSAPLTPHAPGQHKAIGVSTTPLRRKLSSALRHFHALSR